MRLKSLFLSGFQVFEKPTVIPISKITLLFGPNSSGKSAIEDALSLLKELSSKGSSIDKSTWSRVTDQEQNWRRLSDQPLTFQKSMEIGATVLSEIDFKSLLWEELNETPSERLHYEEVIFSIRYKFSLLSEECLDDKDDLRAFRDILFELHNIEFIKFLDNKEISLNLGHPLIIPHKELFLPLYQENKFFHHSNEWISIKEEGDRLIFLNNDHSFNLESFEYSLTNEDITVSKLERNGLIFFKRVFDFFIGYFESSLNNSVDFSIVNASRNIPSSQDLTFIIDNPYDRKSVQDLFEINLGDRQYQCLAASCVAKERASCFVDSDQSQLIDSVNHALSDHLFANRGYSIGYDYRLIVSRNDLEIHDCWESNHPYPVIIRLFLRDAENRQYSFNDVGSGLGYVLPVLVKVLSKNNSYLKVIQQPELHLHPALQASLADTFISASFYDDNQTFLVETHSEHFLLRLLKRIRQTSKNKCVSGDLKLFPEDVAVLYFDPYPDGTTRVINLRISEDGEFLDRWPRGFFSERDKELFDE